MHFGDESFRDGVDLGHDEFFAKLRVRVLPTTSQPTDAEFAAAYEEARRRYEHVFSLHLSRKMSGTFQAAERAAQGFDGVEVYDLRTVSAAHGDVRRAPARPPRARLHARRGAGLHRAFHRTASCSSTPRPSSTCAAAGASAGPPRWSAASSTSSRSSTASTASSRPTPRSAARRRRSPPWSASSTSTARPTTSCYYCLIDALNAEEIALVDEMIKRVRPKAHFHFRGRVGAVVGTHIGPGTTAFALIVE